MRTPISACLTMVVLGLVGATAARGQVHVPGDYATIQAAINSGAILVYVADGTYNETLAIQRTVTLLPEPPADPRLPTPFPRVTGMNITRNTTDNPDVYVRGFHFTGPVTQTNGYVRYGPTTIEGCKLDAGFTTYGSSGLSDAIKIRSCVITGNVFLYSYYNEFTGNMVWKGYADIHSNGANGALVRDNLVIGPSTAGLLSTSGDAPGLVRDNIVSGVTTGYSVVTGTASGNQALDCVTGFSTSGSGFFGRTFSGNTARRCGVGISVGNLSATLHGNQVDSSATYGIHTATGTAAVVTGNVVTHSGSHGMWLEGSAIPSQNSVLLSGGSGIVASGRAEWNVVGRSQLAGIAASGARHNTVYWSSGSGLLLNGSAPDTIVGNIAYGSGAYGLAWIGTGTPTVKCNDWYGNASGATSGVAVGATDLTSNPLFCNVPADDVHLSASSPCVSAPAGCGQIGALGPGCSTPSGAPPSELESVRLSMRPNPARGEVEMRWAPSRVASRIEVFDLAGALRFRVDVPEGETRFRWPGLDEARRALPGGVYFVRRTAGDLVEHARVVIAR